MSDVKWIKLTTDMFDNRKIKHLRKLPEGNNIVLIWVMLLTMAGRCNAGGMIFLTENIPYTTKMLADELDFEENTIILALNALEELGMITTDPELLVIGWNEYQSADGLEKIREDHRQRQQRYRDRKKLEAKNGDVTVTARVTQSSYSISNSISNSYSNSISNIIKYLNNKLNTNYRTNSKNTNKHINARLSEGYTEDDFITVIDKKSAEWQGTDMEKYLRPETLFGSKFEEYLNQPWPTKKQTTGNAYLDAIANRVDVVDTWLSEKGDESDEGKGIFDIG